MSALIVGQFALIVAGFLWADRLDGRIRTGARRGELMSSRPEFPNDIRDVPPDIARVAVFVVAINPTPSIDGRPDADKAMSGCEGGSCLIPAREGDANG